MDTAYGYLLKQANDILRKDLQTFTEIVGAKAKEYKHTVMMGKNAWRSCRTDYIWFEISVVVF